MWVCDVKCAQGVPGLVLTTEQGSVFVQSFHLALYVYWHTVCSRASPSHRRAVNMGITCGKANRTELFFGFRWSPAAFKCCKRAAGKPITPGMVLSQFRYVHKKQCVHCAYLLFYWPFSILFKAYISSCPGKYIRLLLHTEPD